MAAFGRRSFDPQPPPYTVAMTHSPRVNFDDILDRVFDKVFVVYRVATPRAKSLHSF